MHLKISSGKWRSSCRGLIVLTHYSPFTPIGIGWRMTLGGSKPNCYLRKFWLPRNVLTFIHYDDVIMTTIASQITSLTSVYSTVYSDADQRKHQSSPSLAFVWRIHRDRWIPHTKGQLRGKCFHLMTSSWFQVMIAWVGYRCPRGAQNLHIWNHNHICPGGIEFRVTGLCEGNSPVTCEFIAQRTINAENVSIWWRHHG